MKRKAMIRFLLILAVISTGSLKLQNVLADDQYQIKETITAPELIGYEQFGAGVKIIDDLILVGAPKGSSGGTQKSGIVYLFDINGNLVNTIESPNPESNAMFGQSLASDGNLIIIGACDETVESKSMAGRVYVFEKTGDLLYQLQSTEPGTKGHFGGFIDISGGTFIVSEEFIGLDEINMPTTAQDTAEDAESHGKLYIFNDLGILRTRLEAEYQQKVTLFGAGSSMSDKYIVVGEVKRNQIHIYNIEGDLLKTIESPLYKGHFGISTAINDDLIIVGEPKVNLVHVYNVEGNLLHTIEAPSGHEGGFGYYVDIDSDLIVISEPNGNVDDLDDAGYVFVYDTDGNMISMIHSPDPQQRGGFGGANLPRNSISISGNRILVGEFGANLEGVTGAGRVHIIEKGSFTVIVSDLSIEPSSVQVGETVTCTVKCTNSGTFPGNYNVTFKVENELKDEKTISIKASDSETVSFETIAEEAGEFNVDVNGETGSYEVKKVQTGIPGFPIEAIIIGTMTAFMSSIIRKK